MNTRMTILSALGFGASLASSALAEEPGQYSGTQSRQDFVTRQRNAGQPNLYSTMRRLWESHITWTRLFIISAANNLPNKEATTARLLQNQIDIGDVIKPMYGEAAGNRLSALLKDHISIAGKVIMAAKAKDSARVDDQKTRWFDNADQIADLLSDANPDNWNRNDMRSMMRDHLDLTLEEAVAEIKGDYRTSVRKYDQISVQILKMSDMLSDGILNQFPGKYAEGDYTRVVDGNGFSNLHMNAGTVIPFRLNERLSSDRSEVGDRFTANLDAGTSDDRLSSNLDGVDSNYQGMTSGAVLEGHVDVARAKTGTTPGVLGLAFDRIRMPDGQTYQVYGSLIGLDSDSVENRNGRLVAKSGAKSANLKYVGYGAGGGALLAIITKGNFLTDTLIGGALGFLYGEIQKDPSKSSNVTREPGARFGLRLTRDLAFRGSALDKR